MPRGFAAVPAERRLDPALNHTLKRRDDDDHEDDRRQRVEHVNGTHHPVVPTPAKQAGSRPPKYADYQTHQRADEAYQQRDPRAGHHATKQVAPVHIGAKPVSGTWLGELCVTVLVAKVGHPRPTDRKQHKANQENRGHHRRAVASETKPSATVGRLAQLKRLAAGWGCVSHSSRAYRASHTPRPPTGSASATTPSTGSQARPPWCSRG